MTAVQRALKVTTPFNVTEISRCNGDCGCEKGVSTSSGKDGKRYAWRRAVSQKGIEMRDMRDVAPPRMLVNVVVAGSDCACYINID
jgi:hypothetical protein